jgi:hypothetical protein
MLLSASLLVDVDIYRSISIIANNNNTWIRQYRTLLGSQWQVLVLTLTPLVYLFSITITATLSWYGHFDLMTNDWWLYHNLVLVPSCFCLPLPPKPQHIIHNHTTMFASQPTIPTTVCSLLLVLPSQHHLTWNLWFWLMHRCSSYAYSYTSTDLQNNVQLSLSSLACHWHDVILAWGYLPPR